MPKQCCEWKINKGGVKKDKWREKEQNRRAPMIKKGMMQNKKIKDCGFWTWSEDKLTSVNVVKRLRGEEASGAKSRSTV